MQRFQWRRTHIQHTYMLLAMRAPMSTGLAFRFEQFTPFRQRVIREEWVRVKTGRSETGGIKDAINCRYGW